MRATPVLCACVFVVVMVASAPAPHSSSPHTPVALDPTTHALAYILAKANIAKELAKLYSAVPEDTPTVVHSGDERNARNTPGNVDKYEENNEKYQENLHQRSGENKQEEKERHERIHNRHGEVGNFRILYPHNKLENHEPNENVYSRQDKDNYPQENRYRKHHENDSSKSEHENSKPYVSRDGHYHKELSGKPDGKHQENKPQKEYNEMYQDNIIPLEDLSPLLDKYDIPDEVISLINHLKNNKEADPKHNHIVVLKHKNKGKEKDLHVHNIIKENLDALKEDLSNVHAEVIDLPDNDVTELTDSVLSQEFIDPVITLKYLNDDESSLLNKQVNVPSQDLNKDTDPMQYRTVPAMHLTLSKEFVHPVQSVQDLGGITNGRVSHIHSETASIISTQLPFKDEFENELNFLDSDDNVGTDVLTMNELVPLEGEFASKVEPYSESNDWLEYDANKDENGIDELKDFNYDEILFDKPAHLDETSTDIPEYVPFESKYTVEPEVSLQSGTFEDQIPKPLADYDPLQIPVAVVQEPVHYDPNYHGDKADHDLKLNLPKTHEHTHIVGDPRVSNGHNHKFNVSSNFDRETVPVATMQEQVDPTDHIIDHLIDPHFQMHLTTAYHHKDHDHKDHLLSDLESNISLAYEYDVELMNDHEIQHTKNDDHKVDHLALYPEVLLNLPLADNHKHKVDYINNPNHYHDLNDHDLNDNNSDMPPLPHDDDVRQGIFHLEDLHQIEDLNHSGSTSVDIDQLYNLKHQRHHHPSIDLHKIADLLDDGIKDEALTTQLNNDVLNHLMSHDVPISSLDIHSSSHNHIPSSSTYDTVPSSSQDGIVPVSLLEVFPVLSEDAGDLISSDDVPSSLPDPVSLLDLFSMSSRSSTFVPNIPSSSPGAGVIPSLSSSNKGDVQQQQYYQLSFVFNK